MAAYSFTVTVEDDGATDGDLFLAVNGLANLLRVIGAGADIPPGCALTVSEPIRTRTPERTPDATTEGQAQAQADSDSQAVASSTPGPTQGGEG